MEKDKWIAEKISKLIDEGKSKEEAVAIAHSMWDEKYGKDLAESKTFKDIPILTVGQTKNGYKITEKIYNEVRDTYDPKKIHMAPVVGVPHEDGAGLGDKKDEALAWITSGLSEKEFDGKKWLVADFAAVDDKAAKEIERQKKTKKFNSPELFPLDIELYETSKTKKWPDDVDGKYYLRRVNLVSMPAQFGMPQAQLSDAIGRIDVIRLSEIELCEPYFSKSAWCPDCGRTYADSEKYCSTDGTELMHSEKSQEMTMADEKKAEVKEPVKEAPKVAEPKETSEAMRLAELEKKDKQKDELLKAMELQLAEQKKIADEALKTAADERKERKEKEIESDVDAMINAGHISAAGRTRAIHLLSEDSEKPIKLAEMVDGKVVEKEESRADAIKFLLANRGVSGGALKVHGGRNLSDAGKSLNDRRLEAIEKAAEKAKLDLKDPNQNDKAFAIACSENPELFDQKQGVTNG